MVSADFFAWFVIIVSVLIGIFLVFFMEALLRSNRLVVRSKDSNRIEGYYWMVPKKDKKTKIIWWKSVFFQKPIRVPEPPDEAVDINRRGKKWVEVFRLSEDEYVFIKNQNLDPNSKLLKSGKTIKDTIKPFSEVQRQVIINEFAEANKIRQTSWLKENGMNLVALSSLTLIIIMAMVYWGDFAQFALQKDAASTSLLKEAKGFLNEIKDVEDIAPANKAQGSIVQENTEEPPVYPPPVID